MKRRRTFVLFTAWNSSTNSPLFPFASITSLITSAVWIEFNFANEIATQWRLILKKKTHVSVIHLERGNGHFFIHKTLSLFLYQPVNKWTVGRWCIDRVRRWYARGALSSKRSIKSTGSSSRNAAAADTAETVGQKEWVMKLLETPTCGHAEWLRGTTSLFTRKQLILGRLCSVGERLKKKKNQIEQRPFFNFFYLCIFNPTLLVLTCRTWLKICPQSWAATSRV